MKKTIARTAKTSESLIRSMGGSVELEFCEETGDPQDTKQDFIVAAKLECWLDGGDNAKTNHRVSLRKCLGADLEDQSSGASLTHLSLADARGLYNCLVELLSRVDAVEPFLLRVATPDVRVKLARVS